MVNTLGDRIVDGMEYLINETCDVFGIKTDMIGECIRIYHCVMPLVILITIGFGPDWLVFVALIITVCIILAHVVCSGCILTELENKLCKKSEAPIDKLIKTMGSEITEKTTTMYSFGVLFIFTILVIIIYIKRYGKTLDPMMSVVKVILGLLRTLYIKYFSNKKE